MQGAVGQQRVPPDFLREASLPLAPECEQKRIVARVEEQFSQIDEGERALERVQKLAEQYRRSVPKAAVTGELTRVWREQHKAKLESGEALLARILKARREVWEKSELAKMKAKSRVSSKNNWKSKYDEPTAPDIDGSGELPSGWTWASLDQLSLLPRPSHSEWPIRKQSPALRISIDRQVSYRNRQCARRLVFVGLPKSHQ